MEIQRKVISSFETLVKLKEDDDLPTGSLIWVRRSILEILQEAKEEQNFNIMEQDSTC